MQSQRTPLKLESMVSFVNNKEVKTNTPRAKKQFGQHFLVHQAHIQKILDLLEANAKEPLLEIGPGPGTLTFPIIERGHPLVVVEADPVMVDHLAAHPTTSEVGIIGDDFLKLNLDQLISEEMKVVSNLPYNVSVPITAKLLRKTPLIPKMVLMYQREVAARIAAQPGTKDYGTISVTCQCFYSIKKGFDLSPGAFKPPPKVWSRVLVFDRRQQSLLPLAMLPKLEDLLHTVFSHRRKMIGSILKKWSPNWASGNGLLESYLSCGFNPQWRPERLAPEHFAEWLKSYQS